MSLTFARQHRKAFWLAIGLACASVALLLLGMSVGSTGFDSVLNMRNDAQALLGELRHYEGVLLVLLLAVAVGYAGWMRGRRARASQAKGGGG